MNIAEQSASLEPENVWGLTR